MINGHNVHENVFLYKQYEGVFFETLFGFAGLSSYVWHVFDQIYNSSSSMPTSCGQSCWNDVKKKIKLRIAIFFSKYPWCLSLKIEIVHEDYNWILNVG